MARSTASSYSTGSALFRPIPLKIVLFVMVLALGLRAPGRADVPAGVVDQGKAATAYVEVADGSGTAFCIAASGYFVTNAHVVTTETTVKLVLSPGETQQKVVTAQVVRVDKENDLALLKEDDPHPVTALTLGSTTGLRETNSVTTFGYPFGDELAEAKEQYPSVTVSTGHITALRRQGGVLKEIQLDASLNPGNSGGPVLSDNGQVIGIVSSGIPGAALNFAIPVEQLRAMLTGADILFQPAPIPMTALHQPAEFRIRVTAYSGPLIGLTVTLRLHPEGEVARIFTARSVGSGVFVVNAVPSERQSPSLSPLTAIAYHISVSQNGRSIGEVTGQIAVGEDSASRPARSDGSSEPPKAPASDHMAPGVLLPALHPATQIPDKAFVSLPAPIDDVAVGGGGRYLVLSLKSVQKLAIFDCQACKIVHYISVDSADYHVAAGARSLVIILDDRKIIERWSLDTFTRELVAPEPDWAAVRDMRMGSASAGPVVVGLQNGDTKWIDLASLAHFEVPAKGSPYGWGGAEGIPFAFRLSPNGLTIVGWVEGLSPRTIVTAQFDGDYSNFTAASTDGYNGFYYTLGADGSLLYTSAGIDTYSMVPISPDVFGHFHCLPVAGGSFFLAVSGPSLSLYTTTDKRLLLTLPKLDELEGAAWDVEKQIFLVPAANLLVTIPGTRDKLVIRRFNLVEKLAQSGIDYLFVASVPPAVFHAGRRYVYQLDVKSKRGGVKYTLDSGPSGMTLSKTGLLEWAVPADYASTDENIIIRVGDGSGQEIYHTFRVSAR